MDGDLALTGHHKVRGRNHEGEHGFQGFVEHPILIGHDPQSENKPLKVTKVDSQRRATVPRGTSDCGTSRCQRGKRSWRERITDELVGQPYPEVGAGIGPHTGKRPWINGGDSVNQLAKLTLPAPPWPSVRQS